MRALLVQLAPLLLGSYVLLACGADSAPPPKQPDAVKPTSTTSTRPRVESGRSHSTGPTYEEALAEPEDVMALRGERELTNEELTAPMKSPTFLNSCNAPDSMSVTVKVAVRDGKALGVSVSTTPDDPTVAECIDSAIRNLTWPASKHRDSFTTTF